MEEIIINDDSNETGSAAVGFLNHVDQQMLIDTSGVDFHVITNDKGEMSDDSDASDKTVPKQRSTGISVMKNN